jgi:hypothetical protein
VALFEDRAESAEHTATTVKGKKTAVRMEIIFILEVSAVVIRIAFVEDMLVRDISYLMQSASSFRVGVGLAKGICSHCP